MNEKMPRKDLISSLRVLELQQTPTRPLRPPPASELLAFEDKPSVVSLNSNSAWRSLIVGHELAWRGPSAKYVKAFAPPYLR